MRVLTFIPALLLAAAGFVAATPVPSRGSNTVLVAASVRDVGTRDNIAADAVQAVANIAANAAQNVGYLANQLTSNYGQRSTPDVNRDTAIVVQITGVISSTVTQLNAVPKVDLFDVDLTVLGGAILTLLAASIFASIMSVLNTLVDIVNELGVGELGPLRGAIIDLLQAVLDLVPCLQTYDVGPLTIILGPALANVSGTVNLLSNILG